MADIPGQSSIPSTPIPGGAAAILTAEHPAPATPSVAAPPVTPPATPPVAADPTPWKDGEVWKIGDKEWWEHIPEEGVRETMKAKQYANPAIAAMAYSNLLKLQNGNDNVIAVPVQGATPEQQAAFEKTLRTKLGVPETPDKYELQLGENADPKFVEFGKKAFHEAGIPPAKAQQFVNSWNGFVAEQNAAALAAENAANDAAVTALETRWGAELPANLAAGKKAMVALGLDATTVEAIEAKIGTAPVVEFLALIGRKAGESPWLGNGAPNDPNDPAALSPAAASARATALRGDAAFEAKYTDAKHPEHSAAVATMEALMRRASDRT